MGEGDSGARSAQRGQRRAPRAARWRPARRRRPQGPRRSENPPSHAARTHTRPGAPGAPALQTHRPAPPCCIKTFRDKPGALLRCEHGAPRRRAPGSKWHSLLCASRSHSSCTMFSLSSRSRVARIASHSMAWPCVGGAAQAGVLRACTLAHSMAWPCMGGAGARGAVQASVVSKGGEAQAGALGARATRRETMCLRPWGALRRTQARVGAKQRRSRSRGGERGAGRAGGAQVLGGVAPHSRPRTGPFEW